MKGIILAGGLGTRLFPASIPVSKILLPVYDKPMIYYPLSTLMLAGIKDILIITNPLDINNFKKLLGDGSEFGLNLSYEIQYEAKGIADAFLIGEKFINNDDVALVLGDNIFHGFGFRSLMHSAIKKNRGATIFGSMVKDPKAFGVAEFDENRKVISLEEKPKNPKSNYAVAGLYFYDKNVVDYAKTLTPSGRGELEITDLNKIYLEKGTLDIEILGRGFAWLDSGTHESLLKASNFIHSMEENQGVKIACLEEIALNERFISRDELVKNLASKGKSDYYDYIRHILQL